MITNKLVSSAIALLLLAAVVRAAPGGFTAGGEGQFGAIATPGSIRNGQADLAKMPANAVSSPVGDAAAVAAARKRLGLDDPAAAADAAAPAPAPAPPAAAPAAGAPAPAAAPAANTFAGIDAQAAKALEAGVHSEDADSGSKFAVSENTLYSVYNSTADDVPTGKGRACVDLMPGCMTCGSTSAPAPAVAAAAAGRKLMGSGKSGGGSGGKTDHSVAAKTEEMMSHFRTRGFRQATNFKCLSCNATAGYRLNERAGRCECISGFGSLRDNAVCDYCPAGYISRGGWLAKCVECDSWAWPNEFGNECVCVSGTYGMVNTLTGQAQCNTCPDYAPVSLEGSTTPKNCTACALNKEPSEDMSMCVTLGTGISGGAGFGMLKARGEKLDKLDVLRDTSNVTAPAGWEALRRANITDDFKVANMTKLLNGTVLLPNFNFPSQMQPGFEGAYNATFNVLNNFLGADDNNQTATFQPAALLYKGLEIVPKIFSGDLIPSLPSVQLPSLAQLQELGSIAGGTGGLSLGGVLAALQKLKAMKDSADKTGGLGAAGAAGLGLARKSATVIIPHKPSGAASVLRAAASAAPHAAVRAVAPGVARAAAVPVRAAGVQGAFRAAAQTVAHRPAVPKPVPRG